MRNIRIILVTLLMLLANSVMACSCGWGEYFYVIDSLAGTPESSRAYYVTRYGVNDLDEYESKSLSPVIKDNGHGHLSITVPITEKLRGHNIRFLLESVVGIELEAETGFVNKSIFSTIDYKPSDNVLEVTGTMNHLGNKWKLHVLAIDAEGKIIAKQKHTGQDTCGTDIYVTSIERAKALDSRRDTGCFQTWGYYKQ